MRRGALEGNAKSVVNILIDLRQGGDGGLPEANSTTPAELSGLTSAEAQRRRTQFGPNVVAEAVPPRWRSFAAKFWAPVPWMLEAAALVQIGLGEYAEAGVVGLLLVFNAVLAFFQEGRAGAALAALKQRLAPTALVRRDGAWMRLPAAELVPGDAIRLALGALVPADARIVAGSILLDQSALTGESVPVDAGPGGQAYAGSLVRRGQAVAEVTATGPKTYFGRAAELVRVAHAASTEQRAVLRTTRNLALINGAIALAIILYASAIGLSFDALVGLALTALLASIPLALPATFTLSAAIGAQTLARRGVLVTRLSAAHEAAAMDLLCSDKTGTLTRNALTVDEIVPMPGFDRARVLALAVLASAEGDQDPIDAAIRRAAGAASPGGAPERVTRFVPFDPATRMSEALVTDREGGALRIVKGAFHVIADVAQVPADARAQVDALAARGHRVIALALGASNALRLAGLIAISDPPRDDSAALIASLQAMGVRTVMITGDSPATAAAIARRVGIVGDLCPTEQILADSSLERCGIFARVVPEQKYRLVEAFQRLGRTVGMCGDGTNDAPALRQAQIGIAVSSATDVAKAAAAVVLTEPGLGGIVFAVREGRVAFQRLLTYVLAMLAKKIELVLLLATGLVLTGQPVITPTIMVLLFVTNDFLNMSLTTDRASPARSPARWRMRAINATALILGGCKLAFSTAMLAFGKFRLGLGPAELQTLTFVTLVFGNQALLYVVRERGPLWNSKPGAWVLASSAVDIGLAATLALSGILMAPVPWRLVVPILGAALGFALLLDRIKPPLMARFAAR